MKQNRRNFLKSSATIAGLFPTVLSNNNAFASTKNIKINTGLLQKSIISDLKSDKAFPIVENKIAAPIWYDDADFKGVIRAANDLQSDINKVTNVSTKITSTQPIEKIAIIIGTIGKNKIIDKLIADKKINGDKLIGKWESFVIATIDNPTVNIKKALVIAGSDKRGTIYGIYEISEQLGVSPWYWWADVPPAKRINAFVSYGQNYCDEPAVKYRGIFINDEAPCMTRWTNEKFGGFNSKMYTHMFELLLRLRANYLWPAMWLPHNFNEDDPNNPKLADEYGIVMGTSHHEPMIRSQQEWQNARDKFGNGEWNYNTNSEGLKQFWKEGIRRNKDYESLVTVGMRGDGDLAMPSAGSMEANIKVLEGIIDDQRNIIASEMGKNPHKVPQLWALFTEVQKFYEHGMKVPDDVTLLWCDDNTGSLRHLPTEKERMRSGGNGIYYHLDMHGGPYAYQWINTNPFPKIWEQMNLAHQYGANRIWIANVGDLKPLELPIEFFIKMAWKPDFIKRDEIEQYTVNWANREFGPDYATQIAQIVSKYTKYNGWRKPDVVEPHTYSIINYNEAEKVSNAWNDVTASAEAIYKLIPQEQKDAYYQLVLHPTKASAIVNEMNTSAGKSQLYARQGRASTNLEAEKTIELFYIDKSLSDYYNHTMSNGKWNHMMDQPHIGQYSWQPPRVNKLPEISKVIIEENDKFGVAIEGDDSAWPDHYGEAILPEFDSLNYTKTYFEVFKQGSLPIQFEYKASQPWIIIEEDTVKRNDKRFNVGIDWQNAPIGKTTEYIDVIGKEETIRILVPINKATQPETILANGCFATMTGNIAFAATDATKIIAKNSVGWEPLPNYGRGKAAMTIFPVTSKSFLVPDSGPYLEYPLFLGTTGDYTITIIIGPVMDFVIERGMRLAFKIDDNAPITIDIFENRQNETFLGDSWTDVTKANARYLNKNIKISEAGKHSLKLIMIDPGIVIQKIIISKDKAKKSYFGPPEAKLYFNK